MKIKKSLVEKIIKEETERIKNLIVLQEERKKIIKQINELYQENEEIDEAFGLSAIEQGKEAVETYTKLKGNMSTALQPYLKKAQELYGYIWGSQKGKSPVDTKQLKNDFTIISKPLIMVRGMTTAVSGQMGGQGGSGQAAKGEKYKLLQTDPKKALPNESSEFDRILAANYAPQAPQQQTPSQPQQPTA